MNRKVVNELYGKARAGVVLYQPAKNHYESQPIKMFEYMAAGLPFVASDFPLWKEIAEGNNCGICINPQDSNAVKDACLFLLNNPSKAQSMGLNGRRAIENVYNWTIEEKSLISLYKQIEA